MPIKAVEEEKEEGQGEMPRQHQPQPFPLPLRRRSSATLSAASLPPAFAASSRHSMPRLSITSLGSAARTFRNIAAFIVPEEELERERQKERERASERRASLLFMADMKMGNRAADNADETAKEEFDKAKGREGRKR